MSKFINLAGQEFHRLTVISRAENNKHNHAQWLCLCVCGNKRIVNGDSLRRGKSKSCGCSHISHGLSKSAEYRIWKDMRYRCKNPKHKGFHYYGERGIRVCKQWENSFKAFFKDMGSRPTLKHSIDRKNNDGNYEPNNCRWATPLQQRQNTGRSKNVTFNGITFCHSEWSRRFGGSRNLFYERLKLGWSLHKILSTPARKRIKK